MKIEDIQYYRYKMVMAKPYELPVREGLLVALFTKEGKIGCGEIAPLPGVSRETLEDVVGQCNGLAESKPKTILGIAAANRDFAKFPSMLFGFETAIEHLKAQQANYSMVYAYPEKMRETIEVNALLQGSTDEVLSEGAKRVAEGYRTLKVKIGRQNVAADVAMIQALYQEHGNKVTLRVDANRHYSFHDAVEFAKATRHCNVEYIEEPTKEVDKLAQFVEKTKYPVALDETMREPHELDFFEAIAPAAVICKPTLDGGVMGMGRHFEVAGMCNAKIVMTSCYESGLGLSVLAQLAASIPSPSCAHGLSTFSLIQNDVMTPPLRAFRGILSSAHCYRFYRTFCDKVVEILLRESGNPS